MGLNIEVLVCGGVCSTSPDTLTYQMNILLVVSDDLLECTCTCTCVQFVTVVWEIFAIKKFSVMSLTDEN